jgi:hypothetical protein
MGVGGIGLKGRVKRLGFFVFFKTFSNLKFFSKFKHFQNFSRLKSF